MSAAVFAIAAFVKSSSCFENYKQKTNDDCQSKGLVHLNNC